MKALPQKCEDLGVNAQHPPEGGWTPYSSAIPLLPQRQQGDTGDSPKAHRPASLAQEVVNNKRLCFSKVEGEGQHLRLPSDLSLICMCAYTHTHTPTHKINIKIKNCPR